MARKIELKLDALMVESFETGAEGKDGTVYAREVVSLPNPCISAGGTCPVRTELQTCRLDTTCTDIYHHCIC